MYTGNVVGVRAAALMLGLWLAATPVLGVFCELDCDRPTALIGCHEATGLPAGPFARSAHHPCDHDHTTGSPALLSASAREAVGIFAAGPVATPAHGSIPDVRMASVALHKPLSDRRSPTFSCASVLRI